MPLYEYQCDACTHRFERIQRFSDPPVELCPRCGATVHKMVSSPAFHLKGSGWYATDYAKKSEPTKPSETESGDSKESKGTGESTKESTKEPTKEPSTSKESSPKETGGKDASPKETAPAATKSSSS